MSISLGSAVGAGLASGLSSGFLGMASSHSAYKYQKRLMKLQAKLNYDYTQKQTLNSPSWQRQGLEDANYNPMLALEGYSSGGISSATGAQTAVDPNLQGSLSNAEQVMAFARDWNMAEAQQKNLGANTAGQEIENTWKPDLLQAQIDQIGCETDLTKLSVIGKAIENDYLPHQLKAQLEKTFSEINRNIQEGSAAVSNAESIKRRLDTETPKIEQEVENLKKSGHMTDKQTEQIEQLMRWYGADEVSNIIRNVGVGIGVGSSTIPNSMSGINSAKDLIQELTKLKVGF